MSQQQGINHLEQVLSRRMSFSIGDVLSRGFEIWKSDIGAYISFGLVYMVISLGLSFVPILGQLVSTLLVTPALMLGAIIYSYRVYTNEAREFGSFFDGFGHWYPIVLISLITTICSLALLSPFFLLVGADLFNNLETGVDLIQMDMWDLSSGMKIVLAASLLLLVFLGLCFSFAVSIAGFYELEAIDALKYSYQFVSRQWVWVFLFYVVASLIAVSGVIIIGIGIIITLPMLFAMQFAAFEELTSVVEFYRATDDGSVVNIDDMFG